MKLKLFFFFIAFEIVAVYLSCSDDDCFDRALMESHSGICPADCPGVCGCDGETYCNACIANSAGIRVVGNSPCP